VPEVGVDTILEGTLPTVAANFSSLAAHAAKTQSDWEDELKGAETTRWTISRNVFSGKWRDIINAKDAADYANAQLAVSTRPIKDLFDAAAGNLSSDWDISYYDSVLGLAGGEVQEDGAGNAWWDGFGISARGVFCRFNATDTTTDLQIITIVMPLCVQDPPLLGSKSHMRMYARMNSTADDYVYAEITNDTVALGYAVSGSETEFCNASTATQDGDVWDFIIGTISSNYYFRLKRNGLVVLDYDDTAPVSQMDGSHRSVGFGMYSASRGLLGQTSPGTLAVFSADDN